MTELRYLVLLVCALAPCVSAQVRAYREAPGDLNMEGKYRTLGRLAFTGQMDEAEQKASDLLGRGYRGTRYECWIHDKLASGYERQGNRRKAVAAWKEAMLSCDPSKGTWERARKKILENGGTPPVQVAPPPAPVLAQASARRAPPRQEPVRPAARPRPVEVVQRPTIPRATTSDTATARLLRDAAYRSAVADLESGSYQGVRAAIKKLESLVLDRGFQGSAAESLLQAHIADAHLALALQHYRWAEAAGRSGGGDDTLRRASKRAAEIERLDDSRMASAR